MALLNTTITSPAHGTSSKYVTKLNIKETSTNVSNNTSVVSFTLYTEFSGGSGAWARSPNGATGYVIVDGQRYNFGPITYDFRSTAKKTWYSGTKTITHNTNGSKTIAANFSINLNSTYGGSATGSNSSLVLETIPRASSFTLSASSLNMDSAMTVTIQPASSSFKHTVFMKYGTQTYTTVLDIAAGTTKGSFTPDTATWAKANTTSGSGTAYVIVRTYNGTTFIGESSKTFTLVIPSSVKPVANHTLTGVNILGTSTYVAGISSVKISNSFTGSYDSTLKSYSTVIKVGTTTIQSSNAQSVTSVILNTPTTTTTKTTITTTVTDSRGRTGIKTSTIDVLKYTAPYLKNPKNYRSTATGAADDSGTRMNLGGTAVFTNITGNTGTFKIEYKNKNIVDWAKASTALSATGLVGESPQSKVVTSDAETTYDVRITLQDALKKVVYNYEVSSSAVLLDFLASGNGIAIGKSATKPFVFELASKYSILGGSPQLLSSTANLNNVTDMGAYIQTQNSWATTALNYPEGQAGFLEVFDNSLDGTYPYTLQRYTHYKNERTWSRAKYLDVWQPWRLIAGSIDIKNSVLVTNPEKATVVSAVQSADFVSLELNVTTSKTGWITLCGVKPTPTAGIVVGIRPSASSEMSKVYNGRLLLNGNIQLYIGTAISGSMFITVVYPY